MAQGGNKGKKAVSLREKKDAANAALAALRKEAGEYNSMVSVWQHCIWPLMHYFYIFYIPLFETSVLSQ